MNVLIAEGSKILRSRLIRVAMEVLGEIRIVEASDFKELLAQCTREVPQLIFVDMFLPGGSAIKFLEEIHQRKISTNVAVLMNTPDEVLTKRLLEKGALSVHLKSDGLLEAFLQHKLALQTEVIATQVADSRTM